MNEFPTTLWLFTDLLSSCLLVDLQTWEAASQPANKGAKIANCLWSVLVTTGHWWSLPVTAGQCRSLVVSASYYRSLLVTADQCWSLPATASQCRQLLVTAGHWWSLLVTSWFQKTPMYKATVNITWTCIIIINIIIIITTKIYIAHTPDSKINRQNESEAHKKVDITKV